MPNTDIETAVDALLRVIIAGERDRLATASAEAIKTTPFDEQAQAAIPHSAGPDLASIVADPIGTACRTELRRLGHMIHAAGGIDAIDEAIMHIADMNPAHADWRSVVLESAWGEIGRHPL